MSPFISTVYSPTQTPEEPSYLKVFKNQNWADLWYIDAFAGDGMQGIKNKQDSREWNREQDEVVEFIEGSALRALRIASECEMSHERAFDHFVFIELNEEKLDSLRTTIRAEYPDQLSKCQFVCGDVNKKLPAVLQNIDWSKGRAVSFIDPYATQLEWATLEAFSGTKVDIWLLFPLEAIIRMLPRKNLPNDAWARRLDLVFGDDGWRDLYYDPTETQPTLFEPDKPMRERHQSIKEIVDYATKRYKKAFPCVLEPGLLRTESNQPLFALFSILTNDSKKAQEKAVRIASHLIGRLNE